MIVLDTHVLLWLLEAEDVLGESTRRLVDEALKIERLAVSAISFWEIAMLQEKGRVELAQPLSSWRHQVLDLGLFEIPVTGDIGIAAAAISDFHPDLADRIITATAGIHRATLITADDRILAWKGQLPRQDARM
ncbi:type II toxin-antitoxin system VapC family toxin [Acidobacteria bacterium AH-259-G07]|nr:type II toxin-antitoxin system VapC family toxin [Acidobacteria bacterium AH-259-G07]